MSIVTINIVFISSDVKDRSVLKVVHLNNKNHVSFKQPESDDVSMYVPFTSRPTLASEITYQRLSRLGRVPSTTSVPSRNGSIDDKSTSSTPDSSQTTSSSNTSSSRSLSEPRRRIGHHETTSTNSNLLGQKEIISSPRSGSTTPTTSRVGDDDAR
jgi:hypothetical protein